MDELHSQMRIIQSDSDDKHRSESSSTESSEMPIIINKYASVTKTSAINSNLNRYFYCKESSVNQPEVD